MANDIKASGCIVERLVDSDTLRESVNHSSTIHER